MLLTSGFVLCITLFLGLRFYHIAEQSYWLDEMVSLHFAGNPLFKAIFWDNHPPLYFIFLKIWLFLFGYSELATRGLSVLFSALTLVILLWQVNKRWGGKWAVFAGLLFALSPAQILMSQETRMYTLFELALTVQVFAFLDWYGDRNPRRRIQLAAATVFLLLTHYLAVVILVAETLFALKEHLLRRKWLVPAALVAWGLLVIFVLVDWNFLRWQKQSWQEMSLWSEVLKVGAELFWGHLLIGVGGLVLFILALKKGVRQPNAFTLLLPWFSLFVLILIGVSTTRNVFFARYIEFLTVPFVIFFVVSLREFSRKVQLFSAAVLLVGGIFYIPHIYSITKAPWRDVATYIGKEPGPVYTTRTLTLETPYFSAKNIPVLRFTNVEDLPQKPHPIYLVETYYQGMANFPVIQDRLQKKGVFSEMLQFQRNGSDVVLVLKIVPR